MTRDTNPLAFIVFAQDEAVDRLLQDVSLRLGEADYRVAGFLQHAVKEDSSCCGAVDIEDITSGERWQIMQPLGRHAKGCRLDPTMLAEVSARALARLEERPDLILLNRFGKGESEGQGLRSVFEAASLAGIPVLTSVKETYRDLWAAFAEGMSTELPADEASIVNWCTKAIGAKKAVVNAA
jgi:nucleoside-triphosphatase THEP1